MLGFDVLLQQRPSSSPPLPSFGRPATFGQRAAEAVAATVGSWRFISIQSVVLIAWVMLNGFGLAHPWDPYPFILMNLMLSLQAAYTAPMILMAQNRQAETDRSILYGDYALDLSTNQRIREMTIELEELHRKVDELIRIAGTRT